MKVLINLTPHRVDDLNSGLTLEPAKHILRVQKSSINVETIMGSTIGDYIEEVHGEIPDYDSSKVYVVSKRVADALRKISEYKERDDFVYPVNIQHENIDEVIIDKNGKKLEDINGDLITRKVKYVKGCRGFERASR